eukprot:748670-Hanusia_phi.AAC.5
MKHCTHPGSTRCRRRTPLPPPPAHRRTQQHMPLRPQHTPPGMCTRTNRQRPGTTRKGCSCPGGWSRRLGPYSLRCSLTRRRESAHHQDKPCRPPAPSHLRNFLQDRASTATRQLPKRSDREDTEDKA